MGDGTWFASAQLLRVDVNGNFDTEFMAEETGLDDLAPFQRLAEGLTFFGVDFNGNSRDGGQYGRYRASFSSLKPHPDGTTIGLMTPHLWSYAGAYTGSGEGHFGSDVRSAYIVRFTRTGFDHSFGTEGVSTVGFSSSIDRALDIQVQSDGRIVGVAQLGNGGYQASAGLAQLVFFRVWD